MISVLCTGNKQQTFPQPSFNSFLCPSFTLQTSVPKVQTKTPNSLYKRIVHLPLPPQFSVRAFYRHSYKKSYLHGWMNGWMHNFFVHICLLFFLSSIPPHHQHDFRIMWPYVPIFSLMILEEDDDGDKRWWWWWMWAIKSYRTPSKSSSRPKPCHLVQEENNDMA